jgi:tetratricopeptide (TPR) repeat protein
VFAGCDELIFKHALLRDVTYETVLLRDRRRLHRRAAAWLTSAAGDRLGEYLDTVAHHHRLAGEPAAAAVHFHQAARAALLRGLAASARRSAEQAVEQWAVAGAAVPCDALLVVGESLRRLGGFDAADAALAAALAVAATPGERAETLYQASRVAGDRGDPGRERALLDEAADLDGASPPVTRVHVAEGLAFSELAYGDLDTARRYAEQALALAERTDNVAGLIAANNALGAIAEAGLELDRAERHALACLQIAREIGDVHGEATARGRLGIAVHLRGDAHGSLDDYARAAAHYEAAEVLLRQLGNPMLVAVCLSNLAQARLRLGDRSGSLAACREAMADLAGLGATSPLLFCLLVEADWRLTDGDTERALGLLGLVQAHPVAVRNDHDEIKRIVSRTSLDQTAIERGMAAGAMLHLDEVVTQLLAEPPD